jgi:hypothetical protein
LAKISCPCGINDTINEMESTARGMGRDYITR